MVGWDALGDRQTRFAVSVAGANRSPRAEMERMFNELSEGAAKPDAES